MKHEVSYQVRGERAAVLDRVRGYMEHVGYRLDQCGEDLVYRRGSFLGSLVGFSPVQWQVIVRVRLVQTPNRNMKLSFLFDINTGSQQVTPPEVDFWNFEMYGLECAVTTGADVSGREREIAQQAEMNNWRVLSRLVLMPLVFIPFIIAFVVAIDPLQALAFRLAGQVGQLTVTGSVTAVLLFTIAAGMLLHPLGTGAKHTPASLLLGTAAQTAYYGVFALLIFTSLCLLAAIERRQWVALLIALGGIGTASAAERTKRKAR